MSDEMQVKFGIDYWHVLKCVRHHGLKDHERIKEVLKIIQKRA